MSDVEKLVTAMSSPTLEPTGQRSVSPELPEISSLDISRSSSSTVPVDESINSAHSPMHSAPEFTQSVPAVKSSQLSTEPPNETTAFSTVDLVEMAPILSFNRPITPIWEPARLKLRVKSPRLSTRSPVRTPASSADIPKEEVSDVPPLSCIEDQSTKTSKSSFNIPDSIGSSLQQLAITPNGNRLQQFQFYGKDLPPLFSFHGLYNTSLEESSRTSKKRQTARLTTSGTELMPIFGGSSSRITHAGIPIPSTKLRSSSAPPQPDPSVPPSNLGTYDINDETPPDEPYFKQEFQEALRNGKGVAAQIAGILETCGLAKDQSSQIYSILQSAKQFEKFNASSVCIIGIMGESGAGKSSLINSLLDDPELARTASLGEGCTKVVTEYRLRKPEHTAKYTIEVDRMADIEIEEEIRELFQNYRHFHLSNPNAKDIPPDEWEHIAKQSAVAWKVFQAAFGCNEELTEEYLQDTEINSREMILDQFKSWIKVLRWPDNERGSMWSGTAETVGECNLKTEQFLEGNLWPFIKVIRIFLNSQVLKSGAVLADLPGFHDSNNARVRAAEDYIYACDEIFVVADIRRVASNKSVETILSESLGNNLTAGRSLQGVSVVCTRSEDINERELKKKFFSSGQSVKRARVEELQTAIDVAEVDERPEAIIQIHNAQNELNYIYMTARNEYIEDLVKKTHANLFKKRTLSAFCVSNKDYEKNRRRVKLHDWAIKGSGIQELRRHCHRIPAQAQFRIACHFLAVSLKTLVQRVQLWFEGGSQETSSSNGLVQKLLETLQTSLQKNVLNSINTAGESQTALSKALIIEPMTTYFHEWTFNGLVAHKTWKLKFYHQAILRAFCHRYGDYDSPTAGSGSWNSDLLQPMVKVFSSRLDDHAARFSSILHALEQATLIHLKGFESHLKNFQGAALFAETMTTELDSVKYIFAKANRNAQIRLLSIKRDTTENHASSYVFREMEQAYKDCCDMSGWKVTEKRWARLKEAIGSLESPFDPVLFAAIQSRLQEALFSLTEDIISMIEHDVKDILEQIGNNVDMLCGSEAKVLAANGDFLKRLGGVLEDVIIGMKRIEGTAALVRKEAEERGYSISS